MIELHFTGKCQNCECCELVLDCYETGLGITHYEVNCIHEEACSRMEERAGGKSHGKES